VRANPRRRIDQQAAEAARALAVRREAVLPSDHALEQAATVRRSDVDRAVAMFRLANQGTPLAGLLDGPPGEGERQ
jgi:hypothetical protein